MADDLQLERGEYVLTAASARDCYAEHLTQLNK